MIETMNNNVKKNKKIVCIGNVAYDITIPVTTFPLENTKTRIDNKIGCGGGPAATAAYLLGKWDMDVYFLGIVGNDFYGSKIKEEFKKSKVNIDYLQTSETLDTTSSVVIANTSIGTRTVLSYRNPKLHMHSINLNFKPDIILLDGQEYEVSNKLLDEYKDTISIIDAGRVTDEIVDLCSKVNYIVCSFDFATSITGIKAKYDDKFSLIKLYRKLDQMYKAIVVVTLEEHGCLFKDNNGYINIMPSINVKAVDSTGAGDIFHGAFTYGIARNLPFKEILKLSNIAGALSVTKIGSRYSVPTKKEVKEVYYGIK